MHSTINSSYISVIIPVYNEKKVLKECLDALARQEDRPNKVYIVDNNSSDCSVEIARAYPFVVIVSESVQGICASTKKGLDVAAENGGFLLRIDADCRPNPNWITRVITLFDNNPTAIAVTGPGSAYDTNPFFKFLISMLYMQPYFLLVGMALGKKPLFGSNFAIRTTSWQKVSSETHLLSHQNIHDDIDISYHLLGEGKTLYDRGLKMPISSRPFHASLPKLFERYAVGFRSIFIHWPNQTPWKNWQIHHHDDSSSLHDSQRIHK